MKMLSKMFVIAGLAAFVPAPVFAQSTDLVKQGDYYAPTNTVVLGRDEDLFEKSCLVEDVNLIGVDRLEAPVRTQVKIRYATAAVPATVIPDSDGRLHIEFDAPQRALSPGQSAVLYQDDIVLGGGIIARDDNTRPPHEPREPH